MQPTFVFLGCRRVLYYESKLVAENVGKNRIYSLLQILRLEDKAERKSHGTIYLIYKVKVKCTLVQALRLCTGCPAYRGSRGIALAFHDHGSRRGEGSASRPGRSLPPGKTRYPLCMRLGGPQDRSGQVRKISPPQGFNPRTVRPVASRYSDYATRPTILSMVGKFCFTNTKIFPI